MRCGGRGVYSSEWESDGEKETQKARGGGKVGLVACCASVACVRPGVCADRLSMRVFASILGCLAWSLVPAILPGHPLTASPPCVAGLCAGLLRGWVHSSLAIVRMHIARR